MAIYHCSVKSISRGAGRSIIAAAAYCHACLIAVEKTGEVHDYSRKQGVESSSIYLPSGVNSAWAQDRQRLWNAVDAAEKRINARVGRELVVALPSELEAKERQELAGEMARHIADRYGLAVDVAIHKPSRNGDARNYHAHMLMSCRRITPNGFGEKARELDDRKRGPAEIEHIRAEWAKLANHALEQAGQQCRLDHRSLKAQGFDRVPTVHMGVSACAMERRGLQTERGEINREIRSVNEDLIRQQEKTSIIREDIHERLSNIITRRATNRTIGADTDGKRTTHDRAVHERLAALRSSTRSGEMEKEQPGYADRQRQHVNDFIRELKTKRRASEEQRDNSVSQSMDRKAERERQNNKRERETEKAELGY